MIKQNLKLLNKKKTIISINLKSFLKGNIIAISNMIRENLTSNVIMSQIFLPTKIKRWTFLRGPHVNKNSREQFELRTYRMIIKLTLDSSSKKNVHFIKDKRLINTVGGLPGVELSLKWIH